MQKVCQDNSSSGTLVLPPSAVTAKSPASWRRPSQDSGGPQIKYKVYDHEKLESAEHLVSTAGITLQSRTLPITIDLCFQLLALVLVVFFGIWAILSYRIGEIANEISQRANSLASKANSLASEANSQAVIANQIALLQLCQNVQGPEGDLSVACRIAAAEFAASSVAKELFAITSTHTIIPTSDVEHPIKSRDTITFRPTQTAVVSVTFQQTTTATPNTPPDAADDSLWSPMVILGIIAVCAGGIILAVLKLKLSSRRSVSQFGDAIREKASHEKLGFDIHDKRNTKIAPTTLPKMW